MNNLELALKAVKEASTAIMDIYLNKKIETTIKEDNSPVTQADLLADKIIAQNLSLSNYPILSEETVDNPTRLEHDYIWIVDPIDGTKDFIARTDEFTVNVALCYKQRIILGVIAVPAKSLIYYAEKGKGSYKVNLKTNTTERIFTNKSSDNLTILFSNFHVSETELNLPKIFPIIKNIKRCGSAYKSCLIAEGEGHVYIKLSEGTKEWDVAPSSIIVSEAGGFFGLPNGDELLFNKKDVYNHLGVMALNYYNTNLFTKY
ncbi:MAG: 3'(2'),5'-bisphosphate nucleotidase CysQ [Bacillales bacterium]|jgi:3'(2'), 5'-bisphosphate nucleotidase|nr:3'(2'),5'-bisphosphate nucleotidase CysQ [Bacillales bacterium]